MCSFVARKRSRATISNVYASELGLDLDRFDQDRLSGQVLGRLGRDVASGTTAGVGGTPTLFIDGRLHAGSL
jgi:predicted DsbA family dithiol-disulfide isomerase